MLHIIIHTQKSKLLVLPIKDNAKEPFFQGTLILNTPQKARALAIQDKAGRKGKLQGD